MKLGTRWGFGDAPPAAVPEAIRPAIAEVEVATGPDGTGTSWTLTWLEGRPIATLDDGTVVTVEAGIARIVHETDGDDSDTW